MVVVVAVLVGSSAAMKKYLFISSLAGGSFCFIVYTLDCVVFIYGGDKVLSMGGKFTGRWII